MPGHWVETDLDGSKDRIALLVEPNWKQEKAIVLNLKPGAPHGNSTVAQNQNLVAAPEGIHDERPYLERDPHGGKLRSTRETRNRES